MNTENQSNFSVKQAELVELIKNSKLPDTEKQAWVDIVGDMLESEIQEFIQILKEEKDAIKKIEDKYQSRISDIKTDFNKQWQDFVTGAKLEIVNAKKDKIVGEDEAELSKLRDEIMDSSSRGE
jgi:Rad3-related DNA helicase